MNVSKQLNKKINNNRLINYKSLASPSESASAWTCTHMQLRMAGQLQNNASCPIYNKKLSYRRVTARCVLSVVILPIATQQCRNYLYDKS